MTHFAWGVFSLWIDMASVGMPLTTSLEVGLSNARATIFWAFSRELVSLSQSFGSSPPRERQSSICVTILDAALVVPS